MDKLDPEGTPFMVVLWISDDDSFITWQSLWAPINTSMENYITKGRRLEILEVVHPPFNYGLQSHLCQRWRKHLNAE